MDILAKREGWTDTLRKSAVGLVLVTLVSVVAATWNRVQRQRRDPGSVLSTTQTIPLEYFVDADSFSEVENTKAVLNALAEQTISELRRHRAALILSTAKAESGRGPLETTPKVLNEIEKRIAEFKGTKQELMLAEEQLALLYCAGLHQQWLDRYLAVLYEHPTHDLVGREAERALAISQQSGRQEAILQGFQHLCAIPLAFKSQRIVIALLQQRSPGAGSNPSPPLSATDLNPDAE